MLTCDDAEYVVAALVLAGSADPGHDSGCDRHLRACSMKTAKKVVMSVPKDDLKALVNDPELFTTDFEGRRDQLLLLLLYGLGLRRAEVISLTPSHFDWSRKLVRVIGKRNKERQIPMPALLEEYYLRYVEIRDQLPVRHDATPPEQRKF